MFDECFRHGAAPWCASVALLLGAPVAAAAIPPSGPGGPPPGPPPPMMSTAKQQYTAAIYVVDGKYLPGHSVTSAVHGGRIDADGASHVTIRSAANDFNGVVVRGAYTRYTLSDSRIELSGNGHNDFLAIGAGALAEGGATVVLRRDLIVTHGVVASAAVAADRATLEVYDSVLQAKGGTLPPGYKPVIGPGMLTPPWPLGISGTARATLTMDRSRSYYHHSTIISWGWGALSTDAANGHVYLEADDSIIRVLESGYGTYADNGCEVVIRRSKMITPTYTGIIAGPGVMHFEDINARSGRYGVMIHDVMGSTSDIGRLRIIGGTLRAKRTVILVKSANASITIDGARLVSGDGTLIQSIVNPDPNATKVGGKRVFGVRVKIANAELHGNVLRRDTARDLKLSLTNSHLTGAIEGAQLALDPRSTWTATGNSVVTLLGTLKIRQIRAAPGITVRAAESPGSLPPGRYTLQGGGTLLIATGAPGRKVT